MELTFSGEFTAHLLSMAKKDHKLAQHIARQLLATVDKTVMAKYLLSNNVALELLTSRFRREPEKTVRELQALPATSGRHARGGKLGRLPRTPALQSSGRTKAGGVRRRHRLNADQLAMLKKQVRDFLDHNPWATRKQLSSAVAFPSLALYNRIMGELKGSGEVIQKGQKSKTVYALRSSARVIVGRTEKTAAKPSRVERKARAKKATPSEKRAGAPKKSLVAAAPHRTCPYPGCTNKAAPVFGMMCREHKDLPKKERDRLFEARKANRS